jgi:putative solute:sodium symporter small subunit
MSAPVNFDSNAYWKATLGLLVKVLAIWFICSFGLGIMFADAINGISLGGYPLGFWFAQQGSIYVYVGADFLLREEDERHSTVKFDVHED